MHIFVPSILLWISNKIILGGRGLSLSQCSLLFLFWFDFIYLDRTYQYSFAWSKYGKISICAFVLNFMVYVSLHPPPPPAKNSFVWTTKSLYERFFFYFIRVCTTNSLYQTKKKCLYVHQGYLLSNKNIFSAGGYLISNKDMFFTFMCTRDNWYQTQKICSVLYAPRRAYTKHCLPLWVPPVTYIVSLVQSWISVLPWHSTC